MATSVLLPICPVCPVCSSSHRQSKNGKTPCGSQKFFCHACKKTYNPAPKKQGYPASVRQDALKMYVDGLGFRRIARMLGVHHQSVVNWINAHYTTLTPAPQDKPVPPETSVDTIEMDELFTFVGTKKPSSTS